jgi:hypothetical protein
MASTFELEVHSFGNRSYGVVTLPFSDAQRYFKSEKYSAANGYGEQREIVGSHVKYLEREMANGFFTPSTVTVGLNDTQRSRVKQEGKIASFELLDNETLATLDGGHRLEALGRLAEKDTQAKDYPVTALVLFNGNTKKDFLNLQLGRQVDKSHILSLSVQEKLVNDKYQSLFSVALDIARQVATDTESPFYNQVRFDSSGVSGFPVTTVTSKSSSDIGTSLVGAAKVLEVIKKDATWYSKLFVEVFQLLKEKIKSAMEVGMVLCPPPSGTKGAATMFVGLTNLVAYRLHLLDRNSFTDYDKDAFIKAVKITLDKPVKGNFSGPAKRSMLGDFADKLFADCLDGVDSYYGVPRELVKLFSTSAFDLPKMNKPKKARTAKATPKKKGTGKRGRPAKPKVDENKQVDGKVHDASSLPSSPASDAVGVIEEKPDGEVVPCPWDDNPEELQA